MKEEILKEIDEALEVLKDFNTFKHIFSDDKGEHTLGHLAENVRKIKVLATMQDFKDVVPPKNKAIEKPILGRKSGLVSVRPVGEEYGEKTYLGFLIGDVALGSSIGISEDKIQLNFSGHNPGIFVPELGKIIYGMESWWGEIKSEEDFKKITDEDIQNTWYVKLWKDMNEVKEEK